MLEDPAVALTILVLALFIGSRRANAGYENESLLHRNAQINGLGGDEEWISFDSEARERKGDRPNTSYRERLFIQKVSRHGVGDSSELSAFNA